MQGERGTHCTDPRNLYHREESEGHHPLHPLQPLATTMDRAYMNTYRNTPIAFLKCRAFLHTWEEFVPVGKRRPMGDRVSLLCASCGMERHDIYDTYGGLNGREYVPPEGYPGELSMRDAKVLYLRRRKERSARATHPSSRPDLKVVG